MGTRAVAATGSASVIHHTTISRVTAATDQAAGSRPAGGGSSRSIAPASGPPTRPRSGSRPRSALLDGVMAGRESTVQGERWNRPSVWGSGGHGGLTQVNEPAACRRILLNIPTQSGRHCHGVRHAPAAGRRLRKAARGAGQGGGDLARVLGPPRRRVGGLRDAALAAGP